MLGASGFLGMHVREVAEPGEVQPLTRGAIPPDAGELAWIRLEATPGKGLAEDLERLVRERAPRAVLCLAAMASGAECERDPEAARLANAELPGAVARACAKASVRLVHASTDLVFGAAPAPKAGFSELDPVAPLGVYGATKAAGERAVLEAAADALVVRLPLLFGFSAGRGAGASDSLFAGLLRGDDVFLFDDEWRQPLRAALAARALLALCDRPQVTGVLNLPGPERLSRADFGERLIAAARRYGAQFKAFAARGTRDQRGLAGSRPADTCLGDARARAELGPWSETLDRSIELEAARRFA